MTYKTITFTEKEHEAIAEMINRYAVKYYERLRIEGRTRGNLERAAAKLINAKTVNISAR